MNSRSSKVSGKRIEDILRYDPNDERKASYYRIGADWVDASQYPPIVLLESYSRKDFLRLAWEILRRSPRYRRQYAILKEFKITRSTFSGYFGESYFSNTVLPDFENWQEICLKGHKCSPERSSNDQTFGDYVEERQSGEAWFVMNRRRWVMDLWGLKYLPNPDEKFSELKKDLFEAPAAAILVENSDVNAPRMVSTYAGQNEVVFKLRLDAPLENQMFAIKEEVSRLHSIADQHPRKPSEPYSLGRPKRTKKELAELAETQNDRVLVYDEKHGRTLLKQLELCPLWLRTWDALQAARVAQVDTFDSTIAGKHRWPRLNRKKLIQQFEKDYVFKRLSAAPVTTQSREARKQEGQSQSPLINTLNTSLQVSSVPNWRERSEKYIEGGDDAYRQIVAMAFAKGAEE